MVYVRHGVKWVFYCILGWHFFGGVQASPRLTPRLDEAKPSALQGEIRDASTGNAVAFVQVLLEEAKRTTSTDSNGRFVFTGLPAGTYTLKTFRVGYQSLVRRLNLAAGDTLTLSIQLAPSNQNLGQIEVVGHQAQALEKPAVAIDGSSLRQNLSGTIAETMLTAPGLAMRSMGPAPARPVLRGLGGDRLLVLEDGSSTGDLSSSSADHAVVIEPLNAERIEVIRGPAALAYGSTTLGGVINVIRNFIPTHQPEKLHIGASLQGASVNQSLSAGYMVGAPLGQFALHTDGSIRLGNDVHTPIGTLKNTDFQTYNASLGLSKIWSKGHLGAAYSYYRSAYGIPGGFVGAHPNGVRIKLYRNHVEAQGEYMPQKATQWTRMEVKTNYTYYFHQELEASGRIGMAFQTDDVQVSARAQTQNLGIFKRGQFGISLSQKDYNVGGLVFSPNSKDRSAALYSFQEIDWGKLTLQIGGRYDLAAMVPDQEEETRIGKIRRRDFGGFSGSISGSWHVKPQVSLGLILNRSIRMPALEELYTEGPHLAAYSFDVGNPDLNLEIGYGIEGIFQYNEGHTNFSISLFNNRLPNFIFLTHTGTINNRTLLPVYQYQDSAAHLYGGEVSIKQGFGEALSLEGNASYVRGRLTATNQNLPQMPPLHGNLAVKYRLKTLTLGAQAKFASPQNQLGDFETATKGYLVPSLSAQYHHSIGSTLHTFDLSIENLTNTEYRDHLSRVKSIMPEPGFNAKLLYRIWI